MKHGIKGVVVVAVLAGVFAWGWSYVDKVLERNRDIPDGVKVLQKMEESGAPDFKLTNLKGEEVQLSSFKGKVVLLNFWASWCEPCVREFPSMVKLVQHFNDELVFLAVSADSEESDITSFLKAFKADHPNIHVMWDKEKSVAEKYGTQILPESYVIGKKGELVRKITGVEDWYHEASIKFFENLISGKEISGN